MDDPGGIKEVSQGLVREANATPGIGVNHDSPSPHAGGMREPFAFPAGALDLRTLLAYLRHADLSNTASLILSGGVQPLRGFDHRLPSLIPAGITKSHPNQKRHETRD